MLGRCVVVKAAVQSFLTATTHEDDKRCVDISKRWKDISRKADRG